MVFSLTENFNAAQAARAIIAAAAAVRVPSTHSLTL